MQPCPWCVLQRLIYIVVGVLVQIQQRSRGTAPSGIFYRWAVTHDEAEARRIELLLLNYLRPGLNTADL